MKRMIAVLMLAVLSTLAHGQTRIAVGSSFESTAGELAEAFLNVRMSALSWSPEAARTWRDRFVKGPVLMPLSPVI